jgi:hypothetical protein
MRYIRVSAAVIALTAIGAASPVAAQRMTLDLRSIGASTTENLAGTDLGASLGVGAVLAWRLQPHLHLYGGWDYLHFSADQSFAGANRDFEETGYTFGLRFEHPLTASGGIAYRLDGGGTYKHVEVEDGDGDLILDSGHSLGFEGGAGLSFAIGAKWRLVPMARYRSLSPEFTISTVVTKGDLRYVGFEVGVSYRF